MTAAPFRLRSAEALLLFLIVAFAAVARLHDLGSNPPGLFRDELEKGYTAFELWKTGRHGYFAAGAQVERTRLLPLFIDVFGDKTSAIYQYLSAPIVGLGGLTRTNTRLAAALCGIAAVVLAWGVARRWYGPAPALFAAASIAAMPAAIVFSRWAQQGSTVPPLLLGGTLAAWGALWGDGRHARALAASAGLLFGLAFYAYDPLRLAAPVLVLALCIPAFVASPLPLRRHPGTIFFGTFLLLAVPVFVYAIGGEGSFRFRRVSVFSFGIMDGIGAAMKNYALHFDPRFWFWGGDANPRHQLPAPASGVLPVALAPAIGLGIVALLRGRKDESPDAPARARRIFLMVWLLSAPLAASLTRDGIPHALRSIALVPALTLLAAEGFARIAAARWAAPLAALLLLVAASASAVGVKRLRERRADVWQKNFLEALADIEAANAPEPPYLSTSIPYAPYFALFHERTDPAEWQAKGLEALRTRIVPVETELWRVPTGRAAVATIPGFHEGEPAAERVPTIVFGP